MFSADRILGVVVSVLTADAVDRELDHLSVQPKNYEIGISAKHASLLSTRKGCLARCFGCVPVERLSYL